MFLIKNILTFSLWTRENTENQKGKKKIFVIILSTSNCSYKVFSLKIYWDMLESCRILELELILCAVAEESYWFPFLALGHQMQLCWQNKKEAWLIWGS